MAVALGDINRWTIQPGDRLIVKTPYDERLLTQQGAVATLQAVVRQELGLAHDFPVVILPAGMSIEVVSNET